MNFRDLLFMQFFVLLVIAFLYFLGLFLYLQWVFWWYDIVLHFLGGLWVALATATLLTFYGYSSRFLYFMVAIVVIGILWELFEVAIGAPREENYPLDVTIDLVMDVAGSVAGFLFVRHESHAPKM